MARPRPPGPTDSLEGNTTGIFDPLRKTKPAAPKAIQHHKGLAFDRYIFFYGQDARDTNLFYELSVLVGDQPPTVVGGYAKQTVIDRPLYRGLTVFQGYDPASLQFSVRFNYLEDGSWRTDDDAGRIIEADIAKLEWMAGQARTFGSPPFVYLSSTDSQGNTSPLIPFNYQFSPTSNVPKILRSQLTWPWVITDLQWDQSPTRNPSGFRVRQDATVTVMLFDGTEAPPSIAHHKQSGRGAKALTFIARAGADTPLSIATQAEVAPGAARFQLADAITTYPGNRKLRLKPHARRQTIKHGARVLVPYSY